MSTRPVVSRRDFLKLGQRSAGDAAAQERPVHIVSLLLRLLPERMDEARAAIAAIAGAELHATSHPGKIVVALECADERIIADCINTLHAAPGVLTVSVVSHLTEDADAAAED